MSKSLLTFTIPILALFFISATTQSNYQSYKVENSIIVDRPAAEVWQLISNFENLSKLVPEVVDKTVVNGEGVYASWIIYLKNNLMVKEEMTYFNSKEMELSYIMTKTNLPLSDYLAIQKVSTINKDQTEITFTTYFNSLPENQESLITTFNNFQKTFLNNIKPNL